MELSENMYPDFLSSLLFKMVRDNSLQYLILRIPRNLTWNCANIVNKLKLNTKNWKVLL